nr:MAG TPA: hypothetical protein [Caudoviricetes sp.]
MKAPPLPLRQVGVLLYPPCTRALRKLALDQR